MLMPRNSTPSNTPSIGARAIYKDGWWACARLDRRPGTSTREAWRARSGWDPDNDTWELYYLPDDFSQAKDLATEHPRSSRNSRSCSGRRRSGTGCCRCSALPVFYGILPPIPTVTRYTFPGDVANIQRPHPRITGRSYAIEAELRS